ncbi:MAG: histidine triad nucleotide-binding protein [Dehalococcoidia bacterium]|nr:histidine triad nucleotide-binding protein [Dehalococcoidia bacterium]
MSDPCIFCLIVAGNIPGTFVYRDEVVVAFRDITPRAPVHVLVVPAEHIESLATLDEGHREIGGRLLQAAAEVARIEGVAERGYRVVANTGPESGSEVAHLHLHVLAGRPMRGMG